MAVEISISSEELQKRSIFLGLPVYGGMCNAVFSRSISELTALCAQYGIKLYHHYLMNESLITRARTYVADEFMRSDATHLMFIDSDIGFNANDVIALLAMMAEDSEYDIMCGAYPKKAISWEKLKRAVDKGFADENPNELEKFVGDYVFNPIPGTTELRIDQPVEIMEGGTGFMMIQRKVFSAMEKAYPCQMYRPDHARTENFDGSREIMLHFDCIIDRGYHPQELHNLMHDLANDAKPIDELKNKAKELIELEKNSSKRYLSEDYYFNQIARRLGFKVWLCPWMELKHIGTYVFGGSLPDLARLGVAATVDMEEIKKIREAEKKKKGK